MLAQYQFWSPYPLFNPHCRTPTSISMKFVIDSEIRFMLTRILRIPINLEADMSRDSTAEVIQRGRRSQRVVGATILSVCVLVTPSLEATENYWVAVNHPNASDTNHGRSLVRPFKTLARAVQGLGKGNAISKAVQNARWEDRYVPQFTMCRRIGRTRLDCCLCRR